MRIARSTLIGTAVAMALFGRNGAAQAQESTSATGSNPNDLQEVVVYGIRASLRESLQTKKDATGVEEVVTAEDVGKFPDKNLAEALQRVPGVVTQKDFGEGERINLRGTLDTLTNVTLNGHSLSTADWFILDQQNATRSFNYLMLPADLIGRVEVAEDRPGRRAGGRHRRHGQRRDAQTARAAALHRLRLRRGRHATSARPRPSRMPPVSSASRIRRIASASCWRRSTRTWTSVATASRFSATRRSAAPTPRSFRR